MYGTFPCVPCLQVENLHSALEQERSKTKSLKTEVTKLQVHVHHTRLWVIMPDYGCIAYNYIDMELWVYHGYINCNYGYIMPNYSTCTYFTQLPGPPTS